MTNSIPAEMDIRQIYNEVVVSMLAGEIGKLSQIHVRPYVDEYRTEAWLIQVMRNIHRPGVSKPSRKGKYTGKRAGKPRKRHNYAEQISRESRFVAVWGG